MRRARSKPEEEQLAKARRLASQGPSPEEEVPAERPVATACTCEGGCPRCMPAQAKRMGEREQAGQGPGPAGWLQQIGAPRPVSRFIQSLADQTLVNKVIEIIGQSAWEQLVAMPISSREEKKAVVVQLLRLLQPRLAHISFGTEEVSGELKRDQSGLYASECHYTTNLIVNGLLALGINAEHHNSSEFMPDLFEGPMGHSFPWIAGIGLGLKHGDDLYGTPIQDPALLLQDWESIKAHWTKAAKDYKKARADLENQINAPVTEQQQIERNVQRDAYIENEFTSEQLTRTVQVPTPDPDNFIPLTLVTVLRSAPAALIMVMKQVYQYPDRITNIITRPGDFVAFKLLQISNWVKNSNPYAGLYLPENLRNPRFRLPSTEAEALSVVIQVISRLVLEEGANRISVGTLSITLD